jgi:hypothetical protein
MCAKRVDAPASTSVELLTAALAVKPAPQASKDAVMPTATKAASTAEILLKTIKRIDNVSNELVSYT